MLESSTGFSKAGDHPPRRTARTFVVVALQLAVVGVLGWAALHTTDLDRLKAALTHAKVALLVSSLFPMIVERIVRPFRLAVLLKAPSSFPIIAAQSVSQLANLVLPMRSGEMLLVFLLRSLTPLAGSYALSVIVIDRLLDVLFVLLVFTLALAVLPSLPPLANRAALLLGFGCILALALLVGAAVARRRIIAAVERWKGRLSVARGERWIKRLEFVIDGLAVLLDVRRIGVAIVATTATWILATLSNWMILESTWSDAPLGAAALAICLGVVGTTLVSVPAGIGVTHAAYVLALVAYGATQEIGLAFAILAHFLATLTTAAMGLAGIAIIRHLGGSLKRLHLAHLHTQPSS